MTVVQIISLHDLPPIHSIVSGGKVHALGEVRPFRHHPELARLLSTTPRGVSITWVRLRKDERHDVHTHPVASLLVVCQGAARTLGDVSTTVGAGDLVLIPAGERHGFVGAGDDGFLGLSIQMEESGLFDRPDQPQIVYAAPARAATPIEAIMAIQRGHIERFRDNPLFRLAREGAFAAQDARGRFLDAFQIWSDAFQRMVLARAALVEDRRFGRIAERHLHEEFGHNRTLAEGRDHSARVQEDARLEALSEWFVAQMLRLGDLEKLVLVHCVVEASATIFYAEMGAIFESSGLVRHVEQHDGVDSDHYEMGLGVLRELEVRDVERVGRVLRRGWQMQGLVFERIAELCG